MIYIYRILINLIFIFSPIIIFIRLIKKKESFLRFREKFTFFSKKRKKGKLIWFHGASVGEILSVVKLIRELEKKNDIKQILITSTTLSSANIFKRLKFKKTIHQFFPIDNNFLCQRFLSYWKPKLVIFIDSEIWPNMLFNLKKKSIKHILLNGRITKKSFNRWKKLGSFSDNLFKSFNFTYPQNLETNLYLKKFKVKKIKNLGNLKFLSNTFDSENSINKDLQKFLKKKNFWCAASTHRGEELIAANIQLELQNKIKNFITIIIPRHVQRAIEIANELENMGLKTHLHTSQKKINEKTQIYIVDTYGETLAFYKKCKIIFLGKSLTTEGGQNPLEPLRFNCKVLHGPKVTNFKDIYKELNKNGIAIKVNSKNQLSEKITYLITKKINSKNIQAKINLMGRKILKKTLNEFQLLLN